MSKLPTNPAFPCIPELECDIEKLKKDLASAIEALQNYAGIMDSYGALSADEALSKLVVI